ncbi:MAG: hypothetical protein KA275_02175 [Chitinophagaceae bacterium]|nr:hypothetical protein [Chitinophagaceae bacterium]
MQNKFYKKHKKLANLPMLCSFVKEDFFIIYIIFTLTLIRYMGFKKKMLILAIMFIGITPLFSIKPFRALRIELTNCIDTSLATNIENHLNINGYFVNSYMDSVFVKSVFNKPTKENPFGFYTNLYVWDTVRQYLIIYKDGTVKPNIYPVNEKGESLDNNQIGVEQYLTKVFYNKETKYFYNDSWGIYKILQDTLLIQSLNNALSHMQWNAGERYYILINRNTLIYKGARLLGKKEKLIWMKKNMQHVYNFVPFNFIPPSEFCWLRNKKWAYCK